MTLTHGFVGSNPTTPAMEKINTVNKTIEYRYHTFYCDICNKELGTTEEWEDGYYNKLGEYTQSFNLSGVKWFELEKVLCDKCKDEFNEKIKNALFDLGFK